MQAQRSRRAPLGEGATKCCRSKPWCVYRCSTGEPDVGFESDVVHVKVKKVVSQQCKNANGNVSGDWTQHVIGTREQVRTNSGQSRC